MKISLDDFGAGYSLLSCLQNLLFDTPKINPRCIASMDDAKSRKIIRAILDLAFNLSLSGVAVRCGLRIKAKLSSWPAAGRCKRLRAHLSTR